MKKVKVRICSGKNCRRSGALTTEKILDQLPDDLSNRVKVKDCKCMDLCDDGRYGDPPFVKVQGKPISTASADGVITEIVRAVRL